MFNNDGTIDGSGGRRPGEPEGWSKTDTAAHKWSADPPVPLRHTVPMTYHHIMPWEHIWNYWNVFVNNRAWQVVRAWAYLMKIEGPAEQVIDRIESGVGLRLGLAGADTIDDVETKICWSSWNLVEGPSHRTRGRGALEDPGADLDLHWVGSSRLMHRQKDIAYLDRLMDHCRRSDALTRPHTKETHDRFARQTDAVQRQLRAMRYVRNSEICRFRDSMWRPATGTKDSSGNTIDRGRYDRSGNVVIRDQARHMTWEKMPRGMQAR